MAEFVEINKEKAIQEYEEMGKLKFFNDEEIKKIKEKRSDFEYKLHKHQPNQIIDYAHYEESLCKLIAIKRTEMKHRTKTVCEKSIEDRILRLYNELTKRFPNDPSNWKRLVRFCKGRKISRNVSTIFESMLKHHNKPEYWLQAAKWEIYETKNLDNARRLLLEALQRHSDCKELYLESFDMELREGAKMSAELTLRNNTESQQTLAVRRAQVVYKVAIQNIPTVELLIQLLTKCESYEYATELATEMLCDLIMKFPTKEVMWDILAQRELKGYHMTKEISSKIVEAVQSSGENNVITNLPAIKNPDKSQSTTNIQLFRDVYEAAVKTLNTNIMWKMYIDALLLLNKDLSQESQLKRELLFSALKRAHDSNHLDENHYQVYYEYLLALYKKHQNNESNKKERRDDIIKMLSEASKRFNKHNIWKMWIEFHIELEENDRVDEVFAEAVKMLGKEIATPLYSLLVHYYLSQPALNSKVDKCFKKTVEETHTMQDSYLEWTALMRGIEAARQLFEWFCKYDHLTYDCCEKMLYLESIQFIPKVDYWRKCHQIMIDRYGENRCDVWIEFLKFESNPVILNSRSGNPQNIETICNDARRRLNDNLLNVFEIELTRIKGSN